MGRQLGRRPTGRLVVAGLGFCLTGRSSQTTSASNRRACWHACSQAAAHVAFWQPARQQVPALPAEVADLLVPTHQAPVLLQEAKRKSWGWAPRHCLEQGLQRPVDLAQPEWLGSGPAQPPAAALVRAQAPAHVLQLPAECWALGQAPTA